MPKPGQSDRTGPAPERAGAILRPKGLAAAVREEAMLQQFTLEKFAENPFYQEVNRRLVALAGLRPGSVYVDMSTVSPDASRMLAAEAKAKGASMLDAPVSGSVATLEQGTLSFMVGGDSAALERVRPILQDIGPKITHVGENGMAVAMKVATNLALPVQMLAFSEGILLAEKFGIKRETAVEVILSSVTASPMVKYRGPFVLDMPDEAWFDVGMMQKDLALALELGHRLDVPLPTVALTNEFLTAARGMGLADKDFAALFDVLASLAGVDARG